MQHEHLSYPEALKYLAEKYNIEIIDQIQTAEEKQMQSEIESLYSVVTFAQKHFSENLFQTDEGIAIGLTYFTERGFNKDVVRKFQLGFCPPAWDDLTKAAIDNGYKEEYLVKTGLTIKKDDGGHYDRFRDRVIFPIHNLSGRVVGFTGRILTSDKNKPKYVNSPESEIYNKGKTLYGIFMAKSAIVSQNNCFLVEGNTDVISLFQAGVENVVASSGTALTTDQIRLIKKFTPNITILYDGDEAGLKASIRGIDMVLEEGMNVKIVLFPQGEDPDSYARKHDSTEIKQFINDNSVNFILFKTRLLLDEAQHDPIKKAELIKEIVRTVSLVPDAIHRSTYIRECSEVMQIQEQSLWNELNRIIRKKYKRDVADKSGPDSDHNWDEIPEVTEYSAEKQIIQDPNDSFLAERYLLVLVLNYGQELTSVERPIPDYPNKTESVDIFLSNYIYQVLKDEDFVFTNQKFQKIYDTYFEQQFNSDNLDPLYFINHPDEEISKTVPELFSEKNVLSIHWAEKYKIFTPQLNDADQYILIKDQSSTINGIQFKRISRELANILEELKHLPQGQNNDDEWILLQKKFMEKKAIQVKIGQILGRVIN
jgi:DNA primase